MKYESFLEWWIVNRDIPNVLRMRLITLLAGQKMVLVNAVIETDKMPHCKEGNSGAYVTNCVIRRPTTP